MDISVFNEARRAYSAGDYKTALEGFSQCAASLGEMPSEEVSKFYHLVGNCLMKSGDPENAAESYALALEHAPQAKLPSLQVNLGTALLSSKKYEQAIEAFQAALGFEEYATPYKAYSGIGQAQLKLGDMTAAGAAYRNAALDTANPNPGKALVNLGVCFMELDRPADAVISFETALEVGLPRAAANKARANMGCAYMAQGKIADAISAFGSAMADGTYELDANARRELAMARSLQQRFGDDLDSLKEPPAPAPAPEPFCGAKPGSEPAAAAASEATEAFQALPEQDEASADESAEQAPAEDDLASAPTKAFPVVNLPVASPAPVLGAGEGVQEAAHQIGEDEESLPSPEDTAFFEFDEAKAEQQAKEERRKARKGRGALKALLALVIVVIVVLAVGVVGYLRGYGYPTQESVVKGLFEEVVADSGKTDKYWSPEVTQADRNSQMAAMKGIKSFDITAVQRATSTSAVYVSATLEEGGQACYRAVMARDKIGWDVKYVELYFPCEQ